MKSKWLLTGGGGFVASHFINFLLKQNEDVIVTTRWNEDTSRIEHVKDKIKIVQADLLDLSSLIRVIADNKPDIISHLAAESFVNSGFVSPIITIETNTIGTVNLFEAIRIVKDYIDKSYNPIIHVVSSSEVYGKVDINETPINEDNQIRPGNQYAIGKIGADMTAQFYCKYYNFNVIITRMFTHFSIGRTMKSAEVNFAQQIAKIELSLQEPTVKHGNLNSVRTFADARDAVEAYYMLIKNGNIGEIYNIGGEEVYTIEEMLDYLIELSPMKDKIKKELDDSLMRKLDINLQIVDIDKFKKVCPEWRPKITLKQSLKELLDWCRIEVKNGKRF
jgi:GDPmannose 4,6-dehydratase